MAYTDIDDPSAYFQTTLYTGNGGTQSITNTGNSDLQPDWIWIKARNEAEHHNLIDSVRGNTKVVYSSLSGAEDTTSIQVTGFASDGFALGSGTNTNKNNITYVAWQWKAGTSFSNDASSTSVGTIDSTGSVSTDAGFSIITYAGTGSAGTIAHGLGAALKMIIFKNRSTEEDWGVWHQGFPNNGYIALNTANDQRTNNTFMNNTIPTSSVFSVGNNTRTGSNSHNFVAYCFAEKQGYSKFGSYTGNGNADGPFIYTGFQPAFVMTKRTDGSGDWAMMDTARNPFNVMNIYQKAHAAEADSTDESFNIDSVSNGFKIRYNNGNYNADGGAYLYMAFAADPFVTSTGVPATAR